MTYVCTMHVEYSLSPISGYYILAIRECGSTLYVEMTWTAARAAYRLILK